jgi:hypothetical protein
VSNRRQTVFDLHRWFGRATEALGSHRRRRGGGVAVTTTDDSAESRLFSPDWFLAVRHWANMNQIVRFSEKSVAQSARGSEHEVETRKREALARQQALPKWSIVILALSILSTLIWILLLISMLL